LRIKYTSLLRELTGLEEEDLPVEEQMTMLELLHTLCQHHGYRFNAYLFEERSERPKRYLQFFVDDRTIESLKGLETMVTDTSVVTIAFMPVIGG
jgi:molybdopterin converting factor small subunit